MIPTLVEYDKIAKYSSNITALDSESNHLNNIKNKTTRDVILSIHLTALRYKQSDTGQDIMNQSKIR